MGTGEAHCIYLYGQSLSNVSNRADCHPSYHLRWGIFKTLEEAAASYLNRSRRLLMLLYFTLPVPLTPKKENGIMPSIPSPDRPLSEYRTGQLQFQPHIPL